MRPAPPCSSANERRCGGASRSKVPLKVSTEESWMGVAVIALSPVTQRELGFDPMPTGRQIEVLYTAMYAQPQWLAGHTEGIFTN